MAEESPESTFNRLEYGSLAGSALAILGGGLYYGFAKAIDYPVDPLETTLLVFGSPVLNAAVYAGVKHLQIARQRSNPFQNSALEEIVASDHSVSNYALRGSLAGAVILSLSYGFGYFMGKMT